MAAAATETFFALAYIFFPKLHAAASADMRKIFKRAPTIKNKDEAENRTLEDQLVDEHKKVSGEDF